MPRPIRAPLADKSLHGPVQRRPHIRAWSLMRRRSSIPVIAVLTLILLLVTAPGQVWANSYYKMKPSIVSNLVGGPRYIRCDVELALASPESLPQIELHAGVLRHHILMLIAGQDGSQLQTPAGKEQLRKAALQTLQDQLTELTGQPILADLFFSAYYVQ